MGYTDKIKIGITEFPFDATNISVYEKAFMSESIGIRGMPTDVPTGRHMTVIDLRFILANKEMANKFAEVIAQFRACPFLPIQNDLLKVLIAKADPSVPPPVSSQTGKILDPKSDVLGSLTAAEIAFNSGVSRLQGMVDEALYVAETIYAKDYKGVEEKSWFPDAPAVPRSMRDIILDLYAASQTPGGLAPEVFRKIIVNNYETRPGRGNGIYHLLTAKDNNAEVFRLINLYVAIRNYEQVIEYIEEADKKTKDQKQRIEEPVDAAPPDPNIHVAFQSIEWGTHPSLKFGLMARLSCILFNHQPYMDRIWYISDRTTDKNFPEKTSDLSQCSLFTKGLLPRYLLDANKHSIVTDPTNTSGDTSRSFNACLRIGETVPATRLIHNIYSYDRKKANLTDSDIEYIKSKGLSVEGVNIHRRYRKVNSAWNGGSVTDTGIPYSIKLEDSDRFLTQVSCSITNTPSIVPLQGSQHYTLQFMSRPKGNVKLEFTLPNIETDDACLRFHSMIKGLNNYTKEIYNLNTENEKYRNLYPILLDNPIANLGGLYLFNIEDTSTQNMEGQPGSVSLTLGMVEQVVAPVSYDAQDGKLVGTVNNTDSTQAEYLETILTFLADPMTEVTDPSVKLAMFRLKTSIYKELLDNVLVDEIWYDFCTQYMLYAPFKYGGSTRWDRWMEYDFFLKPSDYIIDTLGRARNTAYQGSIFTGIRKVHKMNRTTSFGDHDTFANAVGQPASSFVAANVDGEHPNAIPLLALYGCLDVIGTTKLEKGSSTFNPNTAPWYTQKIAGTEMAYEDPLEKITTLSKVLEAGLLTYGVGGSFALDRDVTFNNFHKNTDGESQEYEKLIPEQMLAYDPGAFLALGNAIGAGRNRGSRGPAPTNLTVPVRLYEQFVYFAGNRVSSQLADDLYYAYIDTFSVVDLSEGEIARLQGACREMATYVAKIMCYAAEDLSDEEKLHIVLNGMPAAWKSAGIRLSSGIMSGIAEGLEQNYKLAGELAEALRLKASGIESFSAKTLEIQVKISALGTKNNTVGTSAATIEANNLEIKALEEQLEATAKSVETLRTANSTSAIRTELGLVEDTTSIWQKLKGLVDKVKVPTIDNPWWKIVLKVTGKGAYQLGYGTTYIGAKFIGFVTFSKSLGGLFGNPMGRLIATRFLSNLSIGSKLLTTVKVVGSLPAQIALAGVGTAYGVHLINERETTFMEFGTHIKAGLRGYLNSILFEMVRYGYVPDKLVVDALAKSIIRTTRTDGLPLTVLEDLYYRIATLTSVSASATAGVQFTAYPDMNLPTYQEVIDQLGILNAGTNTPAINKILRKIYNGLVIVETISGADPAVKRQYDKCIDSWAKVAENTISPNVLQNMDSLSSDVSGLLVVLTGSEVSITQKLSLSRVTRSISDGMLQLRDMLSKHGNTGIIDYILPSFIEKEVEPTKITADSYADLQRKTRTLMHKVDPAFFILRETVPPGAGITNNTGNRAAREMTNPSTDIDPEDRVEVNVRPDGYVDRLPYINASLNRVAGDDTIATKLKSLLPGQSPVDKEKPITVSGSAITTEKPDLTSTAGESIHETITQFVPEDANRKDLRAISEAELKANYFYQIKHNEIRFQKTQADLNRAFPTFVVLFSRVFENTRIESHILSDMYVYRNILNLDIRSHKLEGHLATFQMYNPMGLFENNVLEFTPRTGLSNENSEFEFNTSVKYGGIDRRTRYSEFSIVPGIWIEIRHGYSSNIDELHTVFTGKIAEVGDGDVITVIAQGHEHELMNRTTQSLTPGWFTGTQYFNYCAELLKDAPAFGKKYTPSKASDYITFQDVHRKELIPDSKSLIPVQSSLLNSLLESRLNASSSLENIWTGNSASALTDKLLKRSFVLNGTTNLEGLHEISRYIHNTVAFPLPMDARATMFVGPPEHLYKYTNRYSHELSQYLKRNSNVTLIKEIDVVKALVELDSTTKVAIEDIVLHYRNEIMNRIYGGESIETVTVSQYTSTLSDHLSAMLGNTNGETVLTEVLGGFGNNRSMGAIEVPFPLSYVPNKDILQAVEKEIGTAPINLYDVVDAITSENALYLSEIPYEVSLYIIQSYIQRSIDKYEERDTRKLSERDRTFVYTQIPRLYEYLVGAGTAREAGDILSAISLFSSARYNPRLTGILFKYFYLMLTYKVYLTLYKTERALAPSRVLSEESMFRIPPGYKPFREIHYINPFDIIRNEIECTVAEMANEVHVHVPPQSDSGTLSNVADLVYGFFGDSFILGRDEIASFSLFQEPSQKYIRRIIEPNAREAGEQVSISWRDLAESMKPMYRGQLVVMGKKAIKPYDWVYINDPYNSLYGFIEVEEVTHSLSADKGWITSITPHAITHYGRYKEELATKLTRLGITATETIMNLFILRRAATLVGSNVVGYFAKSKSLSEVGGNIMSGAGGLALRYWGSLMVGSTASILDTDYYRLMFDTTNKVPMYVANGFGIQKDVGPRNLTFTYDHPVTVSPLTKGGKPWTAGLAGINEYTGDVNGKIFGFVPKSLDPNGLLSMRLNDAKFGVGKTAEELNTSLKLLDEWITGYKYRFLASR